MGTKEVTTPNEAPAQQTEFDQTARLDDKLLFLKQAVMMTVSAAVSVEKDFMDLALEQTTLNNLAESRLHGIQVLESLLEGEKAINAQLQQDLDKVKEELRQLIEQREINDIRCAEAAKKLLEFSGLLEEGKKKIKEMETKLLPRGLQYQKQKGC